MNAIQRNTLSEDKFNSMSNHAKILYNKLMGRANEQAQDKFSPVGYAFLQEGVQLEEPLSKETLGAYKELEKAGIDMLMSKGSSQRVIQIRGVRIQGVRA